MSSDKLKIGSRIKQLREERGLSREQLATACGVKSKTFATYERDEHQPYPDTLVKICEALNVSADYLLGLESLPAPPVTSETLDPERLQIAAQISEKIYEIAQLDQSAGYERDSLTPCGMILESLRALIADSDADFDKTRQQIPAFKIDAAADPAAGLPDLQKLQQKDRELTQGYEDRTLYRADQTGRGIYAIVAASMYKRLIGKPYDKTPVEIPGKTIAVNSKTIKSIKVGGRVIK